MNPILDTLVELDKIEVRVLIAKVTSDLDSRKVALKKLEQQRKTLNETFLNDMAIIQRAEHALMTAIHAEFCDKKIICKKEKIFLFFSKTVEVDVKYVLRKDVNTSEVRERLEKLTPLTSMDINYNPKEMLVEDFTRHCIDIQDPLRNLRYCRDLDLNKQVVFRDDENNAIRVKLSSASDVLRMNRVIINNKDAIKSKEDTLKYLEVLQGLVKKGLPCMIPLHVFEKITNKED